MHWSAEVVDQIEVGMEVARLIEWFLGWSWGRGFKRWFLGGSIGIGDFFGLKYVFLGDFGLVNHSEVFPVFH